MKNIQILVISHKPYAMPADDMYRPMAVGPKAGSLPGFTPDNTGINIAQKNPTYCELTGLYWGWKNLDCDYLGLAHYRRHFKGLHKGKGLDSVLSRQEAEALLEDYDVILPKQRNYFIENVYSHYAHTHYGHDLDKTREVLEELYPDMLPAFDAHMKSRRTHICNMFIMKKELADAYCTFLFNVLFALEKVTDVSGYDAFQARMYGRISELLLDVWLEYNHIDYTEVDMASMEKTNWFKKGGSFLKAKFLHKKYTGSF